MLDSRHITLPSSSTRPSAKLADRYIGPYKILEQLSEVTYRLDLPVALRIHNVFHVSKLKPYHDPMEKFPGRVVPPPPPVETDQGTEYEVEDILDERRYHGRQEYLVKWAGYPLSDATWEPINHLRNAKACVDKFRKHRAQLRAGVHSSRGGECNGVTRRARVTSHRNGNTNGAGRNVTLYGGA